MVLVERPVSAAMSRIEPPTSLAALTAAMSSARLVSCLRVAAWRRRRSGGGVTPLALTMRQPYPCSNHSDNRHDCA